MCCRDRIRYRLYRHSIPRSSAVARPTCREYSPAPSSARSTSLLDGTGSGYGILILKGVRCMDSSDIRYILALTRLDLFRYELKATADSLSATISRLTNLQVSMKMLETDLPTLGSGLSSSLLEQAKVSLSLGKEDIERSLSQSYTATM